MKTFVGILFFAAIIGTAIWYTEIREVPIKFTNDKVGMSLEHSSEWIVVNKMDMGGVLSGASLFLRESGGSSEELEQLKQLAPMFVTKAKGEQQKGKFKYPNFTLAAIPIPGGEMQSATGGTDSLLEVARSFVQGSANGAEFKENVFPLPGYPEIKNFFSTFERKGEKVSSYQYTYFYKGFLVFIGFSWTEPEDEEEIKKMINSIEIDLEK